MPDENVNLRGKLLIAMPGMEDTRFERSVVYMCDHNADGAMGLIVNKPTPELAFGRLLEQLSIKGGPDCDQTEIYFGGPVEVGRGFVLHSTDYHLEDMTLRVDESFAMTATRDVLTDIAHGTGPQSALLALGYSGWAAGQLEWELAQNGWLSCDATPEVVFHTANADKWAAALKLLGVDALMLSASAGHA